MLAFYAASILPVLALGSLACWVQVRVGHALPAALRLQVVLFIACMGLVLTVLGGLLAMIAIRKMSERLGDLRYSSGRLRYGVQLLVDQIQRGERPLPPAPGEPPGEDADQFTLLAYEQRMLAYTVHDAILAIADQNVRPEVLVNFARRIQSLNMRSFAEIDEFIKQTEDPDVLARLWRLDHLLTRERRRAESLAVLSGAKTDRHWTRAQDIYEVCRAAVGEVENYERAKVAHPFEGHLAGGAVTDVIHVLAELVENAITFSGLGVEVRAEHVPAGVVITVDDRGVGIELEERNRLNRLLCDPTRAGVDDSGRMGLIVAGRLAYRHKIGIELQRNGFGGTRAVVLLPSPLISTAPDEVRALPGGQAGSAAALGVGAPMTAGNLPAAPTQLGEAEAHASPAQTAALRHDEAAYDLRRQGQPEGLPGPRRDHGLPVASSTTVGSRQAADHDKPPLPRRPPGGGSLPPELRDRAKPSRDASGGGHTAALAAALQTGAERARREDVSAAGEHGGGTTSTSDT